MLRDHVKLAHYNLELVNWKLHGAGYRDIVLSPEIDREADGALDWRRPLWENFYPRIRKEQTPEAAAEIVVRFLHERVTIAVAAGILPALGPGTLPGGRPVSNASSALPGGRMPPSTEGRMPATTTPTASSDRMQMAQGTELPATIAEIWQRQITDPRGFEALYVAALRSVGIPARLNERKQAELLADGKWKSAPRAAIW